jgi:hypothetical protein
MTHTNIHITVYDGEPSTGRVIGWVHEGGCENERCIRAMDEGLMYHALPRYGPFHDGQYHYASFDDAIASIVAHAASPEGVPRTS